MSADEFVDAIEKWVLAAAVESSIGNLEDPFDSDDWQNLSRWFLGLGAHERTFVERIIGLSAGHAVTGFLSVIDGVRAIESGRDKGRLELWYVKGNTRLLINDPNAEPLNDRLHA